ncbi:hypothetical protein BO99DRAFT_329020, partial [Aspergillus violaceofuscus CBS 115571]
YSIFKYKVFLFRLTNRSAVFLKLINKVFYKYFNKFITIYINNIFIYSNNPLKY